MTSLVIYCARDFPIAIDFAAEVVSVAPENGDECVNSRIGYKVKVELII